MPEHIRGSDMVKVLEGETFTSSDGIVVEGPVIVRIQTFDNEDFLKVQGKEGEFFEVKGKTLEDFLGLVH